MSRKHRSNGWKTLVLEEKLVLELPKGIKPQKRLQQILKSDFTIFYL